MAGRRALVLGAAGCLLCGCSGALHRLPQLSQGQLSLAQTEVGRAGGAPLRKPVSDAEALAVIRSAVRWIRPSAEALCAEMKTGVCAWDIRAVADRSLNASAGRNGRIEVNKGIVEYAANEEEVALVIAHEMGHQAANHLKATQRNQAVGALLGGLLLGMAAAYAGGGQPGGADLARSGFDAGANLGGAIGQISYSKEQEREADYLAAVILFRSGVDLDRARGFLVTMARASGRAETGLLDTHPAGPERVAGWDSAVAEVRARRGALPERAG